MGSVMGPPYPMLFIVRHPPSVIIAHTPSINIAHTPSVILATPDQHGLSR